MTNKRKGFTLIELLVVVLIIGILAAVALPQYEKAVLKARVAEYRTNLHSLYAAGTAYALQNNTDAYLCDREYCDKSLDDLDVTVPSCKTFGKYTSCYYRVEIYNGEASVQVFLEASGDPDYFRYDGTYGFTCNSYVPEGKHLCSQLGFTKNVDTMSGGWFTE